VIDMFDEFKADRYIEFAAKAADQWQVNGWGWANY